MSALVGTSTGPTRARGPELHVDRRPVAEGAALLAIAARRAKLFVRVR